MSAFGIISDSSTCPSSSNCKSKYEIEKIIRIQNLTSDFAVEELFKSFEIIYIDIDVIKKLMRA